MRKPTLQFSSLEDLLDFCETAQVFNGFIDKDLFQLTTHLTEAAIELSKQGFGAHDISTKSFTFSS